MAIRRRDGKTGTRFEVYRKASGRNAYVGTYDNERAARAALQDYEVTQRKIASGELPAQVDLDRSLETATTAWLASLKKSKSRSHDVYEQRMRTHVLPALGGVPIVKLTRGHAIDLRAGPNANACSAKQFGLAWEGHRHAPPPRAP